MNTHFTTSLNFKNYSLQKQSQKYYRQISSEIAKWAKGMDLQMKTATFRASEPISVLSFMDRIKTACDSNSVHESFAIWLFPYLILQLTEAAFSHGVRADNKKNYQQKSKLTTQL